MRYLPHLLTGSRFLWSAGLLLFPADSPLFWALYLLCGISDILDGWLARRFHVESVFGARLDSAADFCFTLVLLVRFLPLLQGHCLLLGWCVFICLLRLAAAVTVRRRFGRWSVFHTLSSKATGALLFLRLPLFVWRKTSCFLFLPALASLLSAAEELWLAAVLPTWEPDCPGFLGMLIRHITP